MSVSVGGALQESIGTRGLIGTTTLFALRLYGLSHCLQVSVNAFDMASRTVICCKRILTAATTLEGWDKFKTEFSKHVWHVVEPEGKEKLKDLLVDTIISLVKGVIVWDICIIFAGVPAPAYNSVLGSFGPFMINGTWQGPLARLLFTQFPEQLKFIRSWNFFL